MPNTNAEILKSMGFRQTAIPLKHLKMIEYPSFIRYCYKGLTYECDNRMKISRNIVKKFHLFVIKELPLNYEIKIKGRRYDSTLRVKRGSTVYGRYLKGIFFRPYIGKSSAFTMTFEDLRAIMK